MDPPELTDLVNIEKIVQKYLPKQADIDKILKVIQRKVLKGQTSSYNHKRDPSRDI